jgi:CTP synthase
MEIPEEAKAKIGLFCNVRKEDVIQNLTAPSLYEVPLWLEKEGLADIVCEHLKLENRKPDLTDWKEMIQRVKNCDKKVTIGLVGKYVELEDAYLSVAEALRHGGFENGAEVDIKWIQSENISEENVAEALKGCDGIIVPGGFGDRGIEGMIESVRYARENKIPMFGICLGMQMSVVEFARHVASLKGANSSEFGETPYPVIDIMDSQKDITEKGGTMRLGLYPCKLSDGSRCKAIYGEELIYERHRHRWEFNNEFRKLLVEKGLVLGGVSPDEKLVEIVELPKDVHPWFVGVQFHPEFKSRPNRAHPLFRDFIRASLEAHK